MGDFAETICRGGRLAVWLAGQSLKDITPETFACKPVLRAGEGARTIDTNHPAFVYGHLAGYPSKWLELVGLSSAGAAAPPTFADLFSAGKECRHDPERTVYPPMAEITGAFFASHAAALEALPAVADNLLARPNPREGRMKELFPTIGGMLMFYVNNHVMLHLGQVSAWRRCMGLGPVM